MIVTVKLLIKHLALALFLFVSATIHVEEYEFYTNFLSRSFPLTNIDFCSTLALYHSKLRQSHRDIKILLIESVKNFNSLPYETVYIHIY